MTSTLGRWASHAASLGACQVGQQIDTAAGLDVHKDGAVVAAPAGGVLIDADYSWRWRLWFGKCVDQPPDRAPAGECTENGRQTGTGSARQRKPD